ncbi:MAG: ABC transporter ATP-binding protein [Xanthobacteraceae bacterium]|nr:ABC transporter ATP-binding protein [Xanthobacteraceae bacterium]
MALLETRDLSAFYGDFQALFGISMAFEAGDTVAVIGANGAGKSTLLKAICGLVGARPDAVVFDGRPIGGLRASEIMQLGIAMTPEGRKLFPSLTVEENLLIGADHRKGSGYWRLETVYELFPGLEARRTAAATALSGGQQQMVAIGRALMSNPRLLLCDEISLGLAPVVIRDIYAAMPAIRAQGTTVVIVEQDIVQALAVANKVYCLQEGRVTLSGAPAELSREAIHEAYFGH